MPKILNAEIGKFERKKYGTSSFLAFIDTRTNFRYVLTKAFNQEVVGGALVRYNYNLNRRARKTKAMFTITGRLLNDVVVQVGGDPKVGTFDECKVLCAKFSTSNEKPLFSNKKQTMKRVPAKNTPFNL